MSIDPRTGYVKALVGGRDYSKSKFNLATQGYRQPGSSFKTFVLVTALEKGMPPSCASTRPRRPSYRPSPSRGSSTTARARARHDDACSRQRRASVNTVFARVAWEIGIKNVAKMAKRMGITTKHAEVPLDRTGRANVTPLEMASAYGTLATEGIHRDPVVHHQGRRPRRQDHLQCEEARHARPQGVGAKAAIDILKGVISGGTATRARSDGRLRARPEPASSTATSGSSAHAAARDRQCG